MKKIDEINNYLTDNSSKSRDRLIDSLIKKFEISKKSAEDYYYNWKKEFMKFNSENEKDYIAKVSKKAEEKKEMNEVDGLEVLKEVVIKEVKLKGRNGIYEAKTGLGVALESEGYFIRTL